MKATYIAMTTWMATLLAAAPALASAEEVSLTPQAAVERALRLNLALQYERLNPALTQAAENTARSPYDTTLFASTDVSGSPGTISRARVGLAPVSTTSVGGEVGVRKSFTTGTSVEAKLGTSALFGGSGGLSPGYQSQLSLAVRQNLLKGVSMDANEAAITGAKLGRESAQDQLERKNELIAADTLRTFWDLHAALSLRKVQKVAVESAERTLAETTALIQAGKVAASEEAAARYQVQVQQRTLQQAEQAVGNARDRLARITGLVDSRSLATPEIVTAVTPATALPGTSLQALQQTALTKRGDYLAQRVEIKSRKTQADAANHELLPKLDLVAGMSFTGLSGTSSDGQALTDIPTSYWGSYEMKNVGWSVGLLLEIPLENRAAKAKREVADLEVRRSENLLSQLELGISEELNVAWRAVRTAKQQLEVTESAVKVAEIKLDAERERYRAGKSSAHILTSIEADAVKEKLNKEQAVADFNKALVQLWTASGTLMSRVGSKQG